MQVVDPAQDRLLAARPRGLLPESIRRRCNSTREVFLDCPRSGRRDPRRQPGAIHRFVQQRLGHLGLIIAQEHNQIIMAAGKGIDAARRDLEFRPSGLLRNEPFTLTGNGEYAAKSQIVGAAI